MKLVKKALFSFLFLLFNDAHSALNEYLPFIVPLAASPFIVGFHAYHSYKNYIQTTQARYLEKSFESENKYLSTFEFPPRAPFLKKLVPDILDTDHNAKSFLGNNQAPLKMVTSLSKNYNLLWLKEDPAKPRDFGILDPCCYLIAQKKTEKKNLLPGIAKYTLEKKKFCKNHCLSFVQHYFQQ